MFIIKRSDYILRLHFCAKYYIIFIIILLLNCSPSTFPIARMVTVFTAGAAQAARWKYCELVSIASCPHFNPAARNHVRVRMTHQMLDAMPKK